MATAAERLAAWGLGLRYEDIPQEVVDAAKLHFLDTIGCGLAAHALGVATEGRTMVAEQAGTPDATVIGLDRALPGASAAFANAMLCHGLDFDDTHPASVAHVSAVVTPVALAAAEVAGKGGRDLITAVVLGNETVIRVGMAAPSKFHARGFHPTSICGIFGGTMATGLLTGTGEAALTSALGIAGSFASGIFAYLDVGTATKPMHPAWAAQGSFYANRLGQLGAEGPPTVLEGRFGVYHAFLGEYIDVEPQIADLGSRWETPRIAYKPYPACHYIHGSLGATRSLLGQVAVDDIADILVTLPEAGVALVTEPQVEKRAPRTDYEAKFSLQYSTAAMLVHGQVGVKTYTTEAIADPKVLAVAAKVRYEVKPYPTYPGSFPGGVVITLKDGRTLNAELDYQKGGPENPLSAEEVIEKWRGNAALSLADAEIEKLERTIMAIEEQTDLRAAFAPLASAKAGVAA
jgi:2-methylcitrate dehydratase PrpD